MNNKMKQTLTDAELVKIFRIIKAFAEGQILNPSEDWEMDYFDEPLVDTKGLDALLKKIEKLLPKSEAERISKNVLRRKYDSFNNEIDEDVYEKIEKAFDGRRTIEIGYFDMNSAEVRKREIDVYNKTRKYVIAFCHLRSAVRKFRTSRIVSARLTNKTYELPSNFDKNRY